MNKQTTVILRGLFTPPFPEGDARNKNAWRQFKATYKKLPSGARSLFIKGLKQLNQVQKSA